MPPQTDVNLKSRRLPNGKVIFTLVYIDGCQIDFASAEVMAAYMRQHNLVIAL